MDILQSREKQHREEKGKKPACHGQPTVSIQLLSAIPMQQEALSSGSGEFRPQQL